MRKTIKESISDPFPALEDALERISVYGQVGARLANAPQAVVAAFGVGAALIALRVGRGLRVQYVHLPGSAPTFTGISVRHALAAQAMKTGQPAVADESAGILLPKPARVAAIPLKTGRRTMGVLWIETAHKRALSPQHISALQVFARFLSEYLSQADQVAQTQQTLEALREAEQVVQARMGAQKEAELRLVQAAKLAAVGEMAAGVAHELNNPLTTVVGFTELVMDELPDDAPQKADLDMVLREARRARTVVRRLLDFARQTESTRASTDVNELVLDVLALVRHLLQTNSVDVQLNLDSSLPWAVIDRNQIKQVVLNLIHNALNAMPQGGTLQLASGLRQYAGREWATFAVGDTGSGIAPENLPRIFEPFFTTRSGEGGTGLGLSVTYGIVADHNGRIEVESELGVGSTFTVFLPLAQGTTT